jgi:SAM-dependent methyltransferase
VLAFDEDNARRVEAVYMSPDVVAQRRAIRRELALQPGERVLDVGSGPGFLTTEMALEVGPDGRVHGVDPSESMLALARRRERAPDAAPVALQVADALELPFAGGSLDAVVSTQVLEYVDDVPAALEEARRVLRPGGRLLVLDTDWDSIVWHATDERRMRRVLSAWNEHLADPHLPRRLPAMLREAGLALQACTVFALLNRGRDPKSFSTGLTEMIATYVTGRGGISRAEALAWAQDVADLADDAFFSLNRYVFVATAPA